MSAVGGFAPGHLLLSSLVAFWLSTGHVTSQPHTDFTCLDICNSISYEDWDECLTLCETLLDGYSTIEDEQRDINDLQDSSPEKRRDSALGPLVQGAYYRPARQKSAFIRIGRSTDNLRQSRGHSSFVRIGKKSVEDAFSGLDKRPSSFVRIGKKSLEEELEKRPTGFVRIGKGVNRPFGNLKRVSSFVRIGRGDDEEEQGMVAEDPVNKRGSSFVRIGKRPSNFVRIGKSEHPPMDADELARYYQNLAQVLSKRPSSFVRIGKKNTEPLAEKRPSSFVRIGKSSYDSPKDNEEKRPSSFVRIGKKASSFVRIGKSDNDALEVPESDQAESLEKRPSNFVRIGKRSVDGEEQ